MSDIDDDFPLADHPEYTGPKAGDPDMNRARDLKHYDVAVKRPVESWDKKAPEEAARQHPGYATRPDNPTPELPKESPPMEAWHKFATSPFFEQHNHSAMQMFVAGWMARDSQP